jgi:hypothetical protein
MGKITYQTFTPETPFNVYRTDFLHRESMCGALAARYPGLAPIGAEAKTIREQIDQRRAAIQDVEDDQVRARALEDVAKLDLVEVYAEARRRRPHAPPRAPTELADTLSRRA